MTQIFGVGYLQMYRFPNVGPDYALEHRKNAHFGPNLRLSAHREKNFVDFSFWPDKCTITQII